MYCCLPVTATICLYMLLIGLKDQNNVFKNKAKYNILKAHKKGCFSKDIPIEAIKSYGKKNNATINDVVMALVS